MSDPCEWELDNPDFGSWKSSCGEEFIIIEGTPIENGMAFCCYCGKPLLETVDESYLTPSGEIRAESQERP